LLATVLVAFGLTGMRAGHFLSRGLDASLEGRDLEVTGVVGAMPQRNETGVRFRLEVENCTLAGLPVRLLPVLYLGWYGGVAAYPGAEPQRHPPYRRRGGGDRDAAAG
jgi:competence protein ComEC